jgi:hypothetical protein
MAQANRSPGEISPIRMGLTRHPHYGKCRDISFLLASKSSADWKTGFAFARSWYSGRSK